MSEDHNLTEHFFGVNPRHSQDEGVDYYPSNEDLEYWHNDPPKEIIFASASIRKALMIFLLLNGFTFPGPHSLLEVAADDDLKKEYGNYAPEPELTEPSASQTQLKFDQYLEDNIFNGDGSLDAGDRALLGHFHGVPVYVERQDGEDTKNNDPELQTRNKIDHVVAAHRGEDVIVFSSDTVSSIKDKEGEKLGKPAHQPGFPSTGSEEEISAYLREYVERNYPPGSNVKHEVVAGMVRLGEVRNEEIKMQTAILTGEIKDNNYLKAHAHTGGGGVFQNFVPWDGDITPIITDEASQRLYHLLPDDETRKWFFICQIAGVPWLLFEHLLGTVANKEQKIDEEEKV